MEGRQVWREGGRQSWRSERERGEGEEVHVYTMYIKSCALIRNLCSNWVTFSSVERPVALSVLLLLSSAAFCCIVPRGGDEDTASRDIGQKRLQLQGRPRARCSEPMT